MTALISKREIREIALLIEKIAEEANECCPHDPKLRQFESTLEQVKSLLEKAYSRTRRAEIGLSLVA